MADIWRKVLAVICVGCLAMTFSGCDENAISLNAPSETASPTPTSEASVSASVSEAASGGSNETSASVSEIASGGSNETSEYDHDAVLAAWKEKNPSSLNGQNLAVYEKASQILDEVTTPEMSPYDKELAVHNYLADHIRYDEKALERDQWADADPTSSTPYGALVLDTAICYGYSSAFQLLMDMLGIECLTVDGTINESNKLHSWNMVNLDGNWYHVDLAWDDPVGGVPYLAYFNRPSDDFMMLANNRKWDVASYPEALGGPYEGPQ